MALELTHEDKIIIAYFAGKQRTVPEASKELGMAYSTLIRYTRKLEDAGYLMQVGLRSGKKRYLTTVRNPDRPPDFDPLTRIIYNNKLQTVLNAVTSVSPNPETPVRAEIYTILATLAVRAADLKDSESPGGMTPTEVAVVLRRIKTKLGYWVSLIDTLLNTADLWFDDAKADERIGMTIDNEVRQAAAQFTKRYMAEEKGPLEK